MSGRGSALVSSVIERLNRAVEPTDLRSALAAAAARAGTRAVLPGDAAPVISGAKALVKRSLCSSAPLESSSFRFACTGCGNCCRTLSASVLVDPVERWLIGRDGGRGAAADGTFIRRLGRFEAAGLGAAGVGHLSEGALAVGRVWGSTRLVHPSGVCPVLFLRPSDAGGGDVRCGFAREAPDVPRPPHAPPALTCSLGPARQPYACALYPLGDVWRGGETAWYSVDANKCEGVSPGAPRRQLGDYAGANALEPRQRAAAWYRRLATAHACSGLEVSTTAAAACATAAGVGVERVANALLSGRGAGGRCPPWVDDAVHALSVQLAGEGVGWADVGLQDLLLRILRDRVFTLWYVLPGASGATGSMHEWEGMADGIEDSTLTLHREWEGVVLPAVRGVATRQAPRCVASSRRQL